MMSSHTHTLLYFATQAYFGSLAKAAEARIGANGSKPPTLNFFRRSDPAAFDAGLTFVRDSARSVLLSPKLTLCVFAKKLHRYCWHIVSNARGRANDGKEKQLGVVLLLRLPC